VVRWYKWKIPVEKCVAGRYVRRETRFNDCTRAVIESLLNPDKDSTRFSILHLGFGGVPVPIIGN